MLSSEDRLELLDLYARINRAYDQRNAERFADCFTEDGIYERRTAGAIVRGRAELVELVKKKTPPKGEPKKHVAMNIELEPTSAGATGYSYHFVFTDGKEPPPRFHSLGTCEDRFVKATDGWKIAYRLKLHDFVE